MTPEQDARIRDLPALIANEKGVAKVKLLAAELENLLSLHLNEKSDLGKP